MKCGTCKYEFCYFCHGSANSTSLHFEPSLGCGAPKSGTSIRRGSCYLLLRRISFILLCTILYPLAVAFGPSVFLTFHWVTNLARERGTCARIIFSLLTPVPFIIGLVLDICWIPFAIFGLPIIFVLINMT